MGKLKVDAAGGFPAIFYVFKKGFEARGGLWKLWQRLNSKNTCKTCALGMGGQKGGMVNEAGHFPEVCKKSVQAQAGDMAGSIPESYFKATPIKQFEYHTPEELEKLGRITFPLLATPEDTHFRRISWEEAYDVMAPAFQQAPPTETFFYSSGRASNEAAFLLQLMARAYGSPNIHNCSFYCHQASSVALQEIYGSGTASVNLEDLKHTQVAVVIGANPASNHPRLITQLIRLRRRGGKVIVINPIKELGLVRFRLPSDIPSLLFGSQISDLYLQPKIGSDIHLFKAILKGLMESNQVDTDFIQHHTTQWEAVAQDIQNTPWEKLINECGLDKAQILEAVAMIGQASKGIMMWAMGLTHHTHGVDNILALGNIALARGWLGKEGAGLMPIRGHSNVQGVGSMGVSPQLKKAFETKLESLYHIQIPKTEGQDTYASMKAAEAGKIQVAFLLGGNLYSSNPDSSWAKKAMRNIPLTITVSTKLNEGHFHGRGKTALILPALARDEEPQTTTQESMFNFIRLSQGGNPSVPGEMRSEVQILADLASQILKNKTSPPFDWCKLSSHQTLREAIAQVVPGFEEMSKMEKMRDSKNTEFEVKGRRFETPNIPTLDHKAHFQVTPLPEFSAEEFPPQLPFRLMTLRSEGQFNTVVYDEEDLYRGNLKRNVVMMSLKDAQALGLEEGQRVQVETSAGKMDVSVSVIEIAPGCLAMYYPEANLLVPQSLDKRSKTPGFKCVAAGVKKL